MNFEWIQLLTKDPVTLALAFAVALLSAAALILLFWNRKTNGSQRNLHGDSRPQSAVREIVQTSPEVQKPIVTSPLVYSEEAQENKTSWKKSLFGSTFSSQKGDQLPQIDPADVPNADGSGLLFGGLTGMFASLLPESVSKKQQVKAELRHAGYYQPYAWHNLAALRYLGIVVPIILLGIALFFVPPRFEPWVLGAMIAVPIMGWAIPRLFVRSKAGTRLTQIEHGMPDMIDMLNMCVSQGLPLLPSLKRVGSELKHIHPALSQELQIVSEQADLGTLDQALNNFSQRVDVPEVHSFTTLLTQTERMGTSVSSSLAEYSDNMRESLKQRADEKANTAAFKILFPTALCLMPAVFLFLLGPSIVELSDFFNNGSQVINSATDTFSQIVPREGNR